MSKDKHFKGGDTKPGSSAASAGGDVVVDISGICDCLDAAIALLKECQETQHAELISSLEALLTAINEGNASLTEILAALDLLKECNSQENELLCSKLEELIATLTNEEGVTAIDKLCTLADTVVPAPVCDGANSGTEVGELLVFNDPETDTKFAIFEDGSIQETGSNAVSDAYRDAINKCLAEGNVVDITWTGPDGQAGSATIIGGQLPATDWQAIDIEGQVPMKWVSGTAQCIDESPVESEGSALQVTDPCLLEKACAQEETLDELLEKFCGLQENCCVAEGDIQETSRCQNYRDDETVGDGDPNTTYSVKVNGQEVDLPNPNTDQDVLDALNGICPGWQIVGTAPNRTLCNSNPDSCSGAVFRVCGRGDGPIPNFFCAISASVSIIVEPQLECRDYLRTWSKYEEPTADLIAAIDSNIADLLEKQCEANELAEVSVAKQCLIDDALSGVCPMPVPPAGLNKELQTLTLDGDVTANYPLEQDITLQNANGEACGSATVSDSVVSVYNPDTDQTVITLQECELEEGKTVEQIVKAKPVTKLVKAAIKTVMAFAIKKAVVNNP